MPAGGTTGQVLSKTSATDYDTEWADGGGGGDTKIYGCYSLSTGGVTDIGPAEVQMVLNNTDMEEASLVLASNQVTVNKTGDFKLTADVYLNQSGTSRSEMSIYLKKNGTEIPRTRSGNYQRGYNSGQSSHIATLQPLVSGDVISIHAIRTDGGLTTGYQDDNGTRLLIEEK